MIELLKEAMRSVLFPALVAIATLYTGTKFNESKNDKKEKREAEKQKSILYLKLNKLISSIDDYEVSVSQITSYRDEHKAIKNGTIEYDPEDYNGMTKQDFLNGIIDQTDYLVENTLPVNIEEVKLDYGKFVACSFDKLSPKDSFKCLSILEIGINPHHLSRNKRELENARSSFKPNYI